MHGAGRVPVREEVLVASPRAPIVLRHLTLFGTNATLGRAVAELAVDRYRVGSEPLLSDSRYVRARRTYFERAYPAHARRMGGVAAAFGLDRRDDRFDFSIVTAQPLLRDAGAFAGLATYCPPWTTTSGHGMLSRSGRADATPPELYVMEWYPRGAAQASIALHALDLLSGTLLGVNAAGLAVGAVSVGDVPHIGVFSARAIGLHELQLARYVLDTCTTVDEVQASLLGSCTHWIATPARYLIADVTGRSFVYEPEPSRSAEQLVDGVGEPQGIQSLEGGGASALPDQGGRWRAVVDQECRTLDVIVEPIAKDPSGTSRCDLGAAQFSFTLNATAVPVGRRSDGLDAHAQRR